MASRAESFFQQITALGDEASRVAFIHRLVVDRTLESEFLDFKHGVIQTRPDDLKKQWSKALSGYANTGGGVLIFGIDARKKHGSKVECQAIAPVSRPDELVQQLRDIHLSATDEVVRGVEHLVVKQSDGTGFVVSLVREGDRKPYRAMFADEIYYQRTSDNFITIPHAMLRAMFYPQLRHDCRITILVSRRNALNFGFHFRVENLGVASANALAIRVFATGDLQPRNSNQFRVTNIVNPRQGTVLLTFRTDDALHPGDQFRDLSLVGQPVAEHLFAGLEFHFGLYAANQEPTMFKAILEHSHLKDGAKIVPVPVDISEAGAFFE